MAAPNKCCALDPAPTRLVKRCSGYYYYYYKRFTCSQYEVPEHVSSTDIPKKEEKYIITMHNMRSKTTDGCIAPFVTMMCNRSVLEGHLPISQKTDHRHVTDQERRFGFSCSQELSPSLQSFIHIEVGGEGCDTTIKWIPRPHWEPSITSICISTVSFHRNRVTESRQ